MTPTVLLALFIANLLALAVSLSVLMLAFWQQAGDISGWSVVQFLGAVALYNLTELLMLTGRIFDFPTILTTITINLTVTGFALCLLSTFSLVVSLAGMMKQALQVIARTGFVILILIQWPLWTGGFFEGETPLYPMRIYSPVGIVAAVVGLVYIVLTFGAIWAYRRRIGQPIILAGILLLLLSQTFTLFSPTLREVGLPSLVSAIISAVLGYSLVRMSLFSPLVLQLALVETIHEVSRLLVSTQELAHILKVIARHARQVLGVDVAFILTPAEAGKLVVTVQDGGAVNFVDRRLPVGEGLNGRVFETKLPMRVESYSAWDGRAEQFGDMPLKASLSVPLTYDGSVLGVISVHELESGRLFTDRDQMALEMLATHAAIAIAHANLRERLATLPQSNYPIHNTPDA
jgi:putative methionine-R-sulfoxide reductase with GAF domain